MMVTFVHVFQSCSQDSNAVLAIMEDIIGKLKAIMPTLETVIYGQDNAGCYRSRATIISASKVSQFHGVTVKRLDFSDPQAGRQLLPASDQCRARGNQIAVYSSDKETVLGSSRKLGGAAEHLIDGSEKRICRLSFELASACFCKAQ